MQIIIEKNLELPLVNVRAVSSDFESDQSDIEA